MKLLLLVPLAFLITSTAPGAETKPNAAPAADQPQEAVLTGGISVHAEPHRQLVGQWRMLKGELGFKELAFYANGGLDIRMESKLLSTVYEITVNGVPLQGRILAWRGAGSPGQAFTIRFLSPSEIELTVLYENKGPRKATLRKQRDFRPRAWLLQ